MKKYIVFILGISIYLTSCTKDVQPPVPEQFPNIVGTWKFRGSTEEVQTTDSTYKSWGAAKLAYYPPYSLTFSDNGTGKSDSLSFTYTVEKNTLLITAGNKTVSYTIKESDDKQILLGLTKDGVKEVSEVSNFNKLSLLATYKNLEQIKEETFPVGVYKICSERITDYNSLSDGTSSVNTSRIEYTYNDEGKVIKTLEYSGVGTPYEKEYKRTNYTFDHSLAKKPNYVVNYDILINSSLGHSNTYGLDNSFRIINSNSVSPGNKFPTWTNYIYNEERLIQKKLTEYNWSGKSAPYTVEYFEYTDGNLVNVKTSHVDGDAVTPDYVSQSIAYTNYPVKEKIIYLFSTGKESKKPTHIKEIKNYNNKSVLMSAEKFEYKFDNLNRVTKKFKYDQNNILTQLIEYTYNCN